MELSDSYTAVSVVRPEPLDLSTTSKYSSEISSPTHQSSPFTPPQSDTLGPTTNSNHKTVSGLDTSGGPVVSNGNSDWNANVTCTDTSVLADSIDGIIHTVSRKTLEPVGLNTSDGAGSMAAVTSAHRVGAFSGASEAPGDTTQQAKQKATCIEDETPVDSVNLLEVRPGHSEFQSIAAEPPENKKGTIYI